MAEPVDPSKKHFYISMIKSAVRILGCVVALYTGSVIWLASGFLCWRTVRNLGGTMKLQLQRSILQCTR